MSSPHHKPSHNSAPAPPPVFSVGQVSNLIKSAVESSIGSKLYSADAAGSWSAAILEKCVARLVALDKPFKVQRVGKWLALDGIASV